MIHEGMCRSYDLMARGVMNMFNVDIARGLVVIEQRVRAVVGQRGWNAARKWLGGLVVSGVILGLSSVAPAEQPGEDPVLPGYSNYLSDRFCTACHVKAVDQHSQSFHAQSHSDPLFKGQYFTELLPKVEQEPELYEQEAKRCIACHSPIDSIAQDGRIVSEGQINTMLSGVGCSFCHTVAGYLGEAPGNGNYISNPDGDHHMLGPFMEKNDWHHVYSELHTKSEFCAICHNGSNRHGLEIKATFREWKNSIFAQNGIECQDCHMNAKGFLLDWRSVYEDGPAVNPADSFVRAPNRPKLYTHRFPGAHSETQIVETGDIALYIETEEPSISPGDPLKITVYIDNSGTGHKMPSGSAELRQLWLELVAYNGYKRIPIPAMSLRADAYDVSGNGPLDQKILGEDIPAGSRIYRAILVDNTGKRTLSSYDAVSVLFDNRLNAAELRKETYYFNVPDDIRGDITLKANLNYLPYPGSFARKFGLPKPATWNITSASKTLPHK